MKPSTKHVAKGKLQEIAGQAKETVGRITKNPKLEVEGKIEKATGRMQEKVGQLEKKLGR